MQEVSYGATWYGHPVNMERVRWAGDSLLPRLMEGVKLAGRDADVQPAGQPVLVGCLAGGADVVQVFLLVFHTLADSHLFGGVVEMIDGYWASRAGLLV